MYSWKYIFRKNNPSLRFSKIHSFVRSWYLFGWEVRKETIYSCQHNVLSLIYGLKPNRTSHALGLLIGLLPASSTSQCINSVQAYNESELVNLNNFKFDNYSAKLCILPLRAHDSYKLQRMHHRHINHSLRIHCRHITIIL